MIQEQNTWKNQSCVGVMEYKSSDKEVVVKGYIATTHPDKVNDIIAKETLEMWAKEINDGVPRSNKVSYHHDRSDLRVVGVGVKGSACVKELPDGHHGLYVETKINETHPDFKQIQYEVENGILDSFSIEYLHPNRKESNSLAERWLGTETELHGWTLASRPVNDYAVMVKELFTKEVRDNAELQQKLQDIANGLMEKDPKLKPDKALAAAKAILFNRKELSHSQSLSSKETGTEENTMSEENKQPQISEAELKELREYKEKMEAEKKATEAEKKKAEMEKMKADEEKKKAEEKELLKKELLNEMLESKELNAKFDAVAEKPKMENKEQQNVSIELKEFKESLVNDKLAPSAKLTAAVTYAFKEQPTLFDETKKVEEREFKHVRANGTRLEVKSLGLADNLSPASSAALAGGHQHADLMEALDAGIINLLNDTVSYYDYVQKVNKSGIGSDRALFIVRNGRNPTAGAYTGNAVSTGKGSRRKFGTAFKKYQVGVAVDGDLIAANRGAPQQDVLAAEIEAATLDLKKEINTDAYTEQGLETDAKIIGLEFVADGEGNGTMYGETRSDTNGLKYATADAAKSYASGASGSLKSNLRTMVRNILVDGGNARGIKIFMSPLQYQRLVEGEENALRYATGTNTVGIGSPLLLDGKYEIVSDVDCPDTKVFIVDMSTVEMQFWVTPTYEKLGKRSDSEEGFIKTYLAHYFKAPRRVTMLHSVPETL